ncbi:MAG: DNA methyltransferase [bacterium]
MKYFSLVLDFFLGFGTTTAGAHKLGRRWLGMEMREHFYTVRQTSSDTPLQAC